MKLLVESRNRAFPSSFLPAISLSFCISVGAFLTGCHSTVSAQQSQANDPNYDPASVNMAPVTGDASQAAIQPYPADTQQQQPAPIIRQAPGTSQNESLQRAQEYQQTGQQEGAPDPNQQPPQDQQQDQSQYQQQPDQSQQPAYDNGQLSPDEQAAYDELEADQPPPALPQYDQPPAPAPNYMWTPGYWGYAPVGYYWVPGVWVAAPWPGALWTPGYWGYYGGRYRFHRGYWGRYIGFYGGVPYGFGYTGFGFYGGYWRGNSFFYNRNVTRINNVNITNVYNRTVVVNNYSRVSYNGGPRGIQVQPRPAEIAARTSPRLAPMQSQLAVRQQAQQNRQQFYSANGGRPAMVAASRPIAADPGVRQPIARPMPAVNQPRYGQNYSRPAQSMQAQPQQGQQIRPGNPQVQPTRPGVHPTEPGQPPVQTMRSAPNANPNPTQPLTRQVPPQQVRPEVRPGSPGENNVRPAPQQQPRSMPQPQYRPAPQQQVRPIPEQQYRTQPEPQYRAAPQQMRPVPEQQYHPQSEPQYRPAPQSAPSQPHGEGGGGGHPGGGGGHPQGGGGRGR